MPYTRRYRNRHRRAPAKRGLATVPRMMSKSLTFKRSQQISTKVFYFKQNGVISPDLAGNYYGNWRSANFLTAPAPFGVLDLFGLYDQYKILGYTVKWFPANVGIEPDSALFVSSGLLRGDCITWTDQRFEPTNPQPVNISGVINNASCKMINPRRPYRRSIYRSKGNPEWGSCQNYTTAPDSWDSSIEMLVNGATASTATATPVLFYYTVQWKIVVRGRRQE